MISSASRKSPPEPLTSLTSASNVASDTPTPVSASEPFADGLPQFRSALDYTEVRDFAYPAFHPLHYGTPIITVESSPSTVADDATSEDGPPWQEDSDLESPPYAEVEAGTSTGDIHGKAVALFDFVPENENEVSLKEGQIIWVSYRHGQGWLVAENPSTGESGLVPEEYVEMVPSGSTAVIESHDNEESTDQVDDHEEIFDEYEDSDEKIYASPEGDSEGWVDEESIEETTTQLAKVDLSSSQSEKTRSST